MMNECLLIFICYSTCVKYTILTIFILHLNNTINAEKPRQQQPVIQHSAFSLLESNLNYQKHNIVYFINLGKIEYEQHKTNSTVQTLFPQSGDHTKKESKSSWSGCQNVTIFQQSSYHRRRAKCLLKSNKPNVIIQLAKVVRYTLSYCPGIMSSLAISHGDKQLNSLFQAPKMLVYSWHVSHIRKPVPSTPKHHHQTTANSIPPASTSFCSNVMHSVQIRNETDMKKLI